MYEVFGDVNCLPATELDYRKRGAITEPLLLPAELIAHIEFLYGMVPVTGLEPVRVLPHGILSPGRLPVSPFRHLNFL